MDRKQLTILRWCLSLFMSLAPLVVFATDHTDKDRPADEQYRTKQVSDAVIENVVAGVGTDNNPSPNDISATNVSWYVVSGGGGAMTDGANNHSGTIGQIAGGFSMSGEIVIHHGFWQDFGFGEPCCGRYTGGETGNIDCDIDGDRGLADITLLIGHIYINHQPLCCPANGNVDGDSENELGLSDITRLIDKVYINHTPCAPCP